MKRIVEATKCPNCSGKLEKTADGLRMICPYCNSEFELIDTDDDKPAKPAAEPEKSVEEPAKTAEESKPQKKNAAEPGFNKPEWFEYRIEYKKLLKGHDSKEAMKEFSHCIDELGTSEAIIKYIKRELSDESGICYKGHKEDKLNAFISGKHMKGAVNPSDNILFYVNSGVFSCGKHGFLVTDKKIIFCERKPYTIEYSDLRKIAIDSDSDFISFRLNGSYDTTISVIEGGSHKPHGAFTALISAFAFENEPDREKIIVCKYKDDDDEE